MDFTATVNTTHFPRVYPKASLAPVMNDSDNDDDDDDNEHLITDGGGIVVDNGGGSYSNTHSNNNDYQDDDDGGGGATVLSLQEECKRLTRSNNSLHARILTLTETADEQRSQSESRIRELENARDQLRFVNTQTSLRVRELEGVSDQLRKKLEVALSKRNTYHRENLELPVARTASSSSKLPTPVAIDESQVSIVRAAEERLTQLQLELRECESKEREWQNERLVWQKKIQERDGEIARLSRVVDSHMNWDKVHADYEINTCRQTIEKLSTQLDMVNQERANMAGRVHEFEADGDTRVTQLNQEMNEAKQQVEKLTRDIGVARHQAKRWQTRYNEVQQQLDGWQKDKVAGGRTVTSVKVGKLEEQVKKLKAERDRLQFECRRHESTKKSLDEQMKRREREHGREQKNWQEQCTKLQQELTDERSQHQNSTDEWRTKWSEHVLESELHQTQTDSARRELEESVRILEGDTKRLRNELSMALRTNRELLDQVHSENSSRQEHANQHTVLQEQLDVLQRSLSAVEQERDQFRDKVSELRSHATNHTREHALVEMKLREANTKVSQTIDSLQRTVSERDSISEELKSERMERAKLESQLLESELALIRWQEMQQQAGGWEQEAESMREKVSSQQVDLRKLTRDLNATKTSMVTVEREKTALMTELEQVRKERDALSNLCQDFDRQMVEVQQHVTTLLNDRVSTSNESSSLVAQTREQQVRMVQLQSTLRQQQDENSALAHDKHKLTAEVTAARKHESELQQQVNSLQRNVNDLRSMHSDAEESKNASDRQSAQLKAQLTEYENRRQHDEESIAKLQMIRTKLQTQMEDALTASQTYWNETLELKSLCKQLERSRTEWEQLCAKEKAEREHLVQQLSNATDECTHVKEELALAKSECQQLTRVLNALDKERDELQQDVDKRTETLQNVTELHHREMKQYNELQQELHSTQEQLNLSMTEIQRKDEELTSTLQQLQSLTQKVEASSTGAELKTRELSAVMSDLSNMVKENQYLNGELVNLTQQRDQRQLALEQCLNKCEYLEQVAQGKERDHEDTMVTYKAVIVENEKLSTTLNHMESDHVHMVQANNQLQHRIKELEFELERTRADEDLRSTQIQEYERQIHLLTTTMHHTQQEARRTQDEFDQLKLDVSSARQVSSGLESNQQQTSQRLAEAETQIRSLSVEKEAVCAERDEIRAQRDHLQSMLQQQREKQALSMSNSNVDNGDSDRLREEMSEMRATLAEQVDLIAALETEKSRLRSFLLAYESERQQQHQHSPPPE